MEYLNLYLFDNSRHGEAPVYRGLNRPTPFLLEEAPKPIEDLFNCFYVDKPGVDEELSTAELHQMQIWLKETRNEEYDLIFFSDKKQCPYPAKYLGIDVTGFGGHSMLNEDFFHTKPGDDVYNTLSSLNMLFRSSINQHGLFSSLEVAEKFCGVLHDWKKLFPLYFEDENWEIRHLFLLDD